MDYVNPMRQRVKTNGMLHVGQSPVRILKGKVNSSIQSEVFLFNSVGKYLPKFWVYGGTDNTYLNIRFIPKSVNMTTL